ncbi:MAG: HypC/HybG/HupF family hydrogenase formation chaperone [Clostridiales bacterium]|nr:HypC/HybG/HupF family hydrogenase formation chaperone [Clostridiales bacterium]MCD8367608.1 HypC/HybG/HupF family hydrogenase formation chaperone [Clostridiales bacterium]
MCVALPGRVTAVEGRIATVDFSGNIVRAQAGLVPVKVGDWVLVHAGCILQTVGSSEAEELVDIFREVEQLGV